VSLQQADDLVGSGKDESRFAPATADVHMGRRRDVMIRLAPHTLVSVDK